MPATDDYLEKAEAISTAALAACEEIADEERTLVALMERFRDWPDDHRHAVLADWARSDLWSPALMMLTGWQGKVAREAFRALRVDLEADTVGKRWHDADLTVGRASIIRLLRMDDEPAAYYAAAPFRTWIDDDGRSWIAGAIGCPPVLNPRRMLRWTYLDIRDVLLWEPRSNEVRLMGEHGSTSHFVMPDEPEDEVSVWGDPGEFFRRWAANRARIGGLARLRAMGEWAHPITEPTDGGLPGALLVGSLDAARWPSLASRTIRAERGVSAAGLRTAALRAAALPRFTEADPS